MKESLEQLIDRQKDTLFFYSPYNFIREINPDIQFNLLVKERILSFYNRNNDTHFVYQTSLHEIEFTFIYQYLEWDTAFFKQRCFKLFTVLYTHFDSAALTNAINSFRDTLVNNDPGYIFIDIPSEDVLLIQCLGLAGFKLVETRLHFFKDNILQYHGERYPVRRATKQDSAVISKVAAANRNEYDRLHADVNFSKDVADSYLGTYAQSAINGYCDTVLVPAEDGVAVDAFLALSNNKIEEACLLNCKLTRVVLTAVGPANKGWHKKLVSETIHFAKDSGASHVLMTTQSTNRPVFRTSEKLGFKLGSTSHIFSYSKQSI